MAKRILVFGTTGVEKQIAIDNVFRGLPDIPRIDFERNYVVGPDNKVDELHDYLDCSDDYQRLLWQSAWDDFKRDLDEKYAEKDLILLLHGVTTRPTYGVRSPIYFDKLQQFEPTQIITLIDDVYLTWWRTKDRADDRGDYEGRPTFEQLITARRSEIFLADLISRHCKKPRTRLKNYLLATSHPSRTLQRLLFSSEVKKIYLSFPISDPRALGKEEEINEFLSEVTSIERQNQELVCFCPLAIDELPLTGILDRSAETDEFVEMNLGQRWNVRDFWEGDSLLSDGAPIPGSSFDLVRIQVKDALGLIKTDVSTRDFRMVVQSNRVAVFNPVFEGKLAQGVAFEIDYALMNRIPVYIYQNPGHDRYGEAKRLWSPREGSIRDPSGPYRGFFEDRKTFMDAITS